MSLVSQTNSYVDSNGTRQPASASQFVLTGAATGATVGSIYVSHAIITSGARLVAAEAAYGAAVLLGAVDTVGNGVMAGVGIGGPYGAIVGGLIGLGVFGAYTLTLPDTPTSLLESLESC